MKKASFCFLIIILLQLSNFVLGAIPASERAALIALYNRTNGDSWKFKNGWKAAPLHTDGFAMPGTEGSWYGVTLSGDNVDNINLRGNQLSGSIPPELGNLSNLQKLYLEYNQLSGSIPPQLGNLSNLKELKLDHNQLSGSIPPELGNLSNLKELYLVVNYLSGSIPKELGNLSNLIYLNLDRNPLSGIIPPELGNLNKLETFYLNYSHLSGIIPSELGNLSNLKELKLEGNQLSGGIPSELGNLSNLASLGLRGNQLSGGIPPELGNLSNFLYLYLSHNQLSGSIPKELGNLSNLVVLCLHHNHLSGSIPSELSNLRNLEFFDLNYNQLSGSIPKELGNLSNLHELYLSHNQLNGSIPPRLGNLSNLHELYLSHNQLNNSIPPRLGNLSNLNYLDLSYNQLSGSIPRQLGNLSNLYNLYLEVNYLSGSIPPELGNLSYLNELHLGYNQLSGNIPSNLINLANLYILDVSYNCLSATDSALISWLNRYDWDWEGTQCLEKAPPFGYFDTPIHNSTVCSSIAVTGWALDDYGMVSVKIYREQENALVFIGDAIFVEGARPDVEAAYPGYPGNYRAGWGYMMLTNFLPNGGNGTYALHAIATDRSGKTTTLGTKTIIVDNAHAVKPFGAIDTPIPGETVSISIINWGWALTPPPNKIPIDGSTIDVYIDGVKTGHPTYNIYRSDIASLFPNYANSNGAAGYFYQDTTRYRDGVHTIQWTAVDNAGNIDSIGSRYFTVYKDYGSSAPAAASPLTGFSRHTGQIPYRPRHEENYGELLPVKGDIPRHTINELTLLPEEKEMNELVIKELDRVEIKLGENHEEIMGYLLCSNELKKLPIGSTLDAKTGTLYWSPGPGFLGRYSLVFVLTDPDGRSYKKSIEIEIMPRFNVD